MGFRDTAEIEASFRPVERRLDEMLGRARERFEQERIALIDRSNRSGFGGGFPYFVWSFNFEKREEFGSEIKRSTARLWYLEPALEDEPQTIEVTSHAEIFQISKQSRVRESTKTIYPLQEFLEMEMDEVVTDCLAVAERVLAKY
jgi:hypothetical protein